MARILPAAVKARLAASGGGAAVSLLEVLTFDQNFFAWADCDITAAGMLPVPSVIAGASNPQQVRSNATAVQSLSDEIVATLNVLTD